MRSYQNLMFQLRVWNITANGKMSLDLGQLIPDIGYIAEELQDGLKPDIRGNFSERPVLDDRAG